MNDKLAAIIFGVYIFVVLVFLGRVFFREEDSLKQRLARIQAMGSMDEILLQDEKKRRRSVRQPEWFRVSKRMQEELDGAGVYLSAAEYLGIWLAAATVLPIGSYLTTSNIVVAMMFLAIGLLAPPMTVRILRKKRLDQFSNQLGDALMIMGNCLRSGFSVQQSIERIVTDMPEPISEEFRLAVMEMDYGAPMDEVLASMALRMENKNLALVTTAISIQQKTGGNLSEIIDNVAATIRDRIHIRQTLKTLTAQGRASGMILGCLPIIALIGMTFMNPDYTNTFYTTSFGIKALLVAAVMEVAGFFMVYKIVNIRI